MTAALTLYGMNSPNVRKVALMLEELALPYALEHVAVFRGEQFSPEFLALNPLGKVPVLVDPALGMPLAESGAILLYLAEAHGQLLPTVQPARAEVMQWVMVQMANVGPQLGQLNHFQMQDQGADGPGSIGHAYALGRFTEAARRLYRLLDDRLASREWIAGDAYSIADIATWPWATYLEQHGLEPQAHPALIRWRDRIAARPAAIRMLERTQAAFTTPSTAARHSSTPDDLDRFFGRTPDMPAADYSAISR
ncbi:glutathione S-transferase N-terminal domain-containing protein [Sphingobium sufflavum]|uniref:glutathione S-transferase family protein n=1 Tax=Sphingobium sufflavum TaxID=1129547 RepID=UPI001F3FCAC7|nr:glutathione S-transferase N-terminal domain-containing protein [Sphingobium sufflavum]MCE7795719.1 glutathione S-transferase N-terminal domain-containing protein [Sphingobium sufflavum]